MGFDPNNSPKAVKTKIVAPYTPTAAEDADKVKVEAPALPSACNNDSKPLNLTHPKFARPGKTADQRLTVTVESKISPVLLKYQAKYFLRDQFKKDITLSAFGGAKTMHREDTPLVSPYPAITAWIAKKVQVGGSAWFNNPGDFRDDLIIQNVPLEDLRSKDPAKSGQWDTTLKGQTILSMNTHDWHASVNQKLDSIVARNTFAVVIADVTPAVLTLTTTYTFHLSE
ncbi:MAG: hypothetical protein H0W83_03460 [Planctomycetes bacterium]|nr:hypothetical protein [Planctomycetota bacterium]